jgi:hypothetical protein
MVWLPIGPDDVFSPRDATFKRLSLRNEYGRQGLPNSIAIDPTDAATIYITERPTSGGSSAFRTRTGGLAWTPIADELEIANANVDPACIAVNDAHPATIYLGTYSDGAVYVSSNRGEPGSWSARHPVGAHVRKLIVDTRTTLSLSTTVLYAATDNGIYRSANGGAAWAQIIAGDVWTLVAFTAPAGTAHFYAGIFRSGVWYASASPDTAAGWSNLNALGIGLPPHSFTAGDPGNVDIFMVDLARRTPTRAYAWALRPGTTVALYKTSAPTTSWATVPIAGSAPGPWYGFYALSFAVAPNSPGTGTDDVLLFGSGGIARSIDGGQTWTDEPSAFHADQHAIAFAPESPGAAVPVTFIGCDGGLAKSTRFADPAVPLAALPHFNELDDVADTFGWQNLDHGKQSSAVYALGSHPGWPALAYIGCQDTGLNARCGDLLWRGIVDADGGGAAFAVDTNKVAVWGTLGQYNVWPVYRVCLFSDHNEPSLWPSFVSVAGSLLWPTSNYLCAVDDTCLVGALSRRFPSTTFTAPAGPGTVAATPASMANIVVGKRLAIAEGTDHGETVYVTAVTATTFTANFGFAHPTGDVIALEESFVARADRAGTGSQISQDFLQHRAVKLVARHPGDANFLYCTTEDDRVFFTNTGATAGPGTVWTEIATNRPAGADINGLCVSPSGQAYVLLASAVVSGAVTTPLFRVDAAGWTPEPCASTPGGAKKILTAHPTSNDILFAASDPFVYTLTRAAGTWTWASIGDGLPGGPIYDLWAGNIGTAAAPKILLRAAIPTRGIFERNVTAGESDPAVFFYLRDNILDTGWLSPSPDFLMSPYDGTSWVTHYQCADIKIDVKQTTSSPAIPRYFQTEPETPVIPPLDHILFQQLQDASQTLPQADQALVHVQVHSRTAAASGDVSVWAIYCNASTHVPGLNESASMGNAFPFWSQFQPGGTIVPALPADSPWTSVGAPVTLNGLDAAHPKVASWPWTIPTLASGDPGHYCMVAFVHGPGALIGSPGFVVDAITPANRQIGQKNLHIGPPLPPGPAPGGGTAGGAGGGPAMRAYVELRNPTSIEVVSTVVFDLRALPPGLAVQVQLTPLKTAGPFENALTGLTVTNAPPLVEAPRQGCAGFIGRLLGRRFPKRVTPLPAFARQVYRVQPSTSAEIRGVRLAAHERAAAFVSVHVAEAVEPGTYRFDILQRTITHEKEGAIVGGNTYVVNITGKKPQKQHLPPTHDLEGDHERGEEAEELTKGKRALHLPPWMRKHVEQRAIENREEGLEKKDEESEKGPK